MQDSTGNNFEQNSASSTGENLQTFFIYHLNRIFAAKLRMSEVMEELLVRVAFSDLAVAVRATLNLILFQLEKLEEIYGLLDISPSFAGPNELLRIVEEGYLLTYQQQQETRAFDLSVLAFLQHSESLEIASFKVLRHAAAGLNNRFVSELLDQTIAGAEADHKLLLALMVKHLKNL